jgi:hypothetical protein
MLELGFVREHLDVIEKMAADRGIALDLAPFRTHDVKSRELQQGKRGHRKLDGNRRGNGR